MRILLLHSFYQQPGGEDRSFFDEAALLESRGHEVVRYTLHNDMLDRMPVCVVAGKLLWNRQSYRELRQLIRCEQPDVMHCTNTFPLISPSVYYAARRERVAVVQSLHNYRLLCPNALLLREGQTCERCIGQLFPWSSVVHGCYRDSRAATAGVAAMISFHRAAGTWSRVIDLYLALTEFARQKFIQGGFPPEKIVVKPNFVEDNAYSGDGSRGHAIFVGRLSPEKGIETLLEAWSLLPGTLRLRIVGDGPLAERVAQAAREDHRIDWLGQRSKAEVNALIHQAAVMIVPSICYETFGRAIIEAYVQGVPVIASRLGAMAELVADQRTGLLFEPGNAAALARAVSCFIADPDQAQRMRLAARQEYEARYTAEQNYRFLIAAYEQAYRLRGRPAGTSRRAASIVSSS